MNLNNCAFDFKIDFIYFVAALNERQCGTGDITKRSLYSKIMCLLLHVVWFIIGYRLKERTNTFCSHFESWRKAWTEKNRKTDFNCSVQWVLLRWVDTCLLVVFFFFSLVEVNVLHISRSNSAFVDISVCFQSNNSNGVSISWSWCLRQVSNVFVIPFTFFILLLLNIQKHKHIDYSRNKVDTDTVAHKPLSSSFCICSQMGSIWLLVCLFVLVRRTDHCSNCLLLGTPSNNKKTVEQTTMESFQYIGKISSKL